MDDEPIKDENDISDEYLINIKAYFDRLCYAFNQQPQPCNIHPSSQMFSDIPDGEREADLINLLNTLQRHTSCGNHCLRYDSKGKKWKCRYNFPKPLCEESTISDDDGYFTCTPARNDAYIQRYNPILTAIWRANTDFSPIASLEPVLRYIAKYASKGEKTSVPYLTSLQQICATKQDDSPAKSVVIKVLMSTVGERDYSAQEVAHILMGWPLYKCSRTFINISIYDENWNKLQVRHA